MDLLAQKSVPNSLVQKQQEQGEEFSAESATDARLSVGYNRKLGFEDDSGLTSDLLQLELDNEKFTGERISICNGMNGPHCVEPIDVFIKRRRPGKMAAPGDPDYIDESKEAKIDLGFLAQGNGPKRVIPGY